MWQCRCTTVSCTTLFSSVSISEYMIDGIMRKVFWRTAYMRGWLWTQSLCILAKRSCDLFKRKQDNTITKWQRNMLSFSLPQRKAQLVCDYARSCIFNLISMKFRLDLLMRCDNTVLNNPISHQNIGNEKQLVHFVRVNAIHPTLCFRWHFQSWVR